LKQQKLIKMTINYYFDSHFFIMFRSNKDSIKLLVNDSSQSKTHYFFDNANGTEYILTENLDAAKDFYIILSKSLAPININYRIITQPL